MPRKKNSTVKKTKKSTAKKVEDLKVVDGKSDKEKVKDLEQILGVKNANPFGTHSEEELVERMNGMTITDLQTFGIKVGILPSGNKMILKNKILKAFKTHEGAGMGHNIGYITPMMDPNSEAAKNILKISQEGF
jgi:hypothetical protein|tara:strand:- start:20793 stop:21194 length:402 start_codon:yes stop_codon:yes gene_type:complete